MFEESTRLQIIRLERLKDLQLRHQHELSEFDTLSRRTVDTTLRNHQTLYSMSSNSSRESGSSSPRPLRAFNGGSSRNSDRSLSGSSNRFPLPNRESSVSMTSLQSSNRSSDPGSGSGNSRLYVSQQSHSATNVTRTRNADSRNGNVTDRLSYHDASRR